MGSSSLKPVVVLEAEGTSVGSKFLPTVGEDFEDEQLADLIRQTNWAIEDTIASKKYKTLTSRPAIYCFWGTVLAFFFSLPGIPFVLLVADIDMSASVFATMILMCLIVSLTIIFLIFSINNPVWHLVRLRVQSVVAAWNQLPGNHFRAHYNLPRKQQRKGKAIGLLPATLFIFDTNSVREEN